MLCYLCCVVGVVYMFQHCFILYVLGNSLQYQLDCDQTINSRLDQIFGANYRHRQAWHDHNYTYGDVILGVIVMWVHRHLFTRCH